MRNIIKIVLVTMFAPFALGAQTMTWIPSNYKIDGGCQNLTNCDENIVCYKLKYTPDIDGVLTSYTTGFFADCQQGETALVQNASCLMTDNSRQVEACHTVGKILMNCSGNSGSGAECILQKDVSVILHQVCFQVESGQHVMITEDQTTDLTLSINLPEDQLLAGKTEFPTFSPYKTKNDWICNNPPGDLVLQIENYKEKNKTSLLQWSPIVESGMGNYVLERSVDGKNYKSINTLKDQNFDSDLLRYQVFDEYAEFGFNFYRLRYTDTDREDMTSNIVSIYFFDGNFSVDVYPNPARDLIHLNVNTAQEIFEYTVSDNLGKNLLYGKAENMPLNKINIKSLIPGVYNLSVVAGDKRVSKKFIKVD